MEVGSLWGTTKIYARIFVRNSLALRVGLDFWASEMIPDPSAWDFTDCFLSLPYADAPVYQKLIKERSLVSSTVNTVVWILCVLSPVPGTGDIRRIWQDAHPE